MNRQQVKGATNRATGKVKQAVGKATGDQSLRAKGVARETKGKLQEKLGDAKEAGREDRLERDLDRGHLDKR